jgi:hypothetical protein
LSTVPYAAGLESRGPSRTAWLYINVKLLTKYSFFVGFLISWISLPAKTTKIGTPRIKMISQYYLSVIYQRFMTWDRHTKMWLGYTCFVRAPHHQRKPERQSESRKESRRESERG